MTDLREDIRPALGNAGNPAAQQQRRRVRHGLGREATFDRRVRLATGLLLWAGLLLVSYWWVADGGIRDLGSWASGLVSAGRITGLVSAQLLLVQVLLMSRLPWLEHAYGRVRLARIHRVIGLLSFWLMVAHIVTIIAGYASARWSLVPATSWQLLTGYAGVLLAAAGVVCLVMVVVTSIKVSRRRIRYESWHLLHLYGYLGAGLALPHQLWTGREFLARPAAAFYWWALWIAAAGSVVLWRVAFPLWRGLRHGLRVVSVTWEGSDVVSVTMAGRRLDRLPVRAGQFITTRFLTMPGWTRANPFSLSAAPNGRTLRITAKVVGDGTARLSRLRPGTPVYFEGPYGRLSDRARTRAKVLLAGAGVGITPLRAMAEGLDYRPGDAVLLQRCSGRPLFAREFERLTADRGLKVFHLRGPRPHPRSVLGPIPAGMDELSALCAVVPDLAEREVFLCGPRGWTAGMVRLALRGGVPPENIHTESFQW